MENDSNKIYVFRRIFAANLLSFSILLIFLNLSVAQVVLHDSVVSTTEENKTVLSNSLEDDLEMKEFKNIFNDLVMSKQISIIPDYSISFQKDRVGSKNRLWINYEISWILLNLPLTYPENITNPDNKRQYILEKVDLRPIQQRIISKEKAEQQIAEKSKNLLSLENPENREEAIWDSKSDFLGLEVSRRLDTQNNLCIKAVLNLRNGDTYFSEFDCVIE